jgi:hypothetical protein
MNLLCTISELKSQCANATSIPVSCQELIFLGKAVSKKRCLLDLIDLAIYEQSEQVSDQDSLLLIDETNTQGFKLDFILNIRESQEENFGKIISLQNRKTKENSQILTRVISGMNKKLNPEPTPEGLSGSYFLKDRFRNRVAIFKPKMEEPFAPLNPKGIQAQLGTEVHPSGILSGSLYLREAAAFVVDSDGIFSVPETFLSVVEHPYFGQRRESMIKFKESESNMSQLNELQSSLFKAQNKNCMRMGSVQKMIMNNGSISNISVSKLSAFEVQKIAILDMLILNADRNEGNILFKRQKNEIKLIPIDHGLSFGKTLKIRESEVVWSSFPQIQSPLVPELVDYLNDLNPVSIAMRLKKTLSIDQKSLDLSILMGIFLKMCTKEKLTIAEMVELYYRKDDEKKSPLEKIINNVEFMTQQMRQNEEWYLSNKIVSKGRKMSKQFLNDIINKIESKSLQETKKTQITENYCTKSTFKNLNKKINKKNENKFKKFIKQSEIKNLKSIFNDDSKPKPIIISSEDPKNNFLENSNEDFLFNNSQTSTTQQKNHSELGMRLSTVESINLSENDLKIESKENLLHNLNNDESYEMSRIKSYPQETSCDKRKKTLNLDFLKNDSSESNFNPKSNPFKLKKDLNSSISTQVTSSKLSENLSKKSIFKFKSKKQKFKRSLSAFVARCSKSKKNQIKFLDNFSQVKKKIKIGTLTDLEIKNSFSEKKKTKYAKNQLKFHYFQCFLEQYLEGRRYGRTIGRARRKYTLCLKN